MSKQLAVSATLSTLAMAALALMTSFGGIESGSGSGTRAATAQGSIVSVLLRG